MKRRLGLVFLLCVLPVASMAQVAPIRLKVAKNSRKEMDKASHQVREFESYHIEVANASTAPVSNIVVRWSLLISPSQYWAYAATTASRSPLKVVEGEQTCSVDRVQKCSFDTDEILTHSYLKQEYALHQREDRAAVPAARARTVAAMGSEARPFPVTHRQ